MPVIDWKTMDWEFLDDGWEQLSGGEWVEPWDSFTAEHKARVTGWAWDRWRIA